MGNKMSAITPSAWERKQKQELKELAGIKRKARALRKKNPKLSKSDSFFGAMTGGGSKYREKTTKRKTTHRKKSGLRKFLSW